MANYYCDASRPDDSGDGLSWATAKKTFSAVKTLVQAAGSGHNVYFAKGVYTPTNADCALKGVGASFWPDDTHIYGAQAGSDARDRDENDVSEETLISGINVTSSFRAFFGFNVTTTFTVDGFCFDHLYQASYQSPISTNKGAGMLVVNNLFINPVNFIQNLNSAPNVGANPSYVRHNKGVYTGIWEPYGYYTYGQSYLEGSRDLTFEENAFYKMDVVLNTASGNAADDDHYDYTVQSNYFEGCGLPVGLVRVHGATITGNVFKDTTHYSIGFWYRKNWAPVRINDNVFYGIKPVYADIVIRDAQLEPSPDDTEPAYDGNIDMTNNQFIHNDLTSRAFQFREVGGSITSLGDSGVIDARNCYWGFPTGPSSEGVDAIDNLNGSVADGNGCALYMIKTLLADRMIFAPWLTKWVVTGVNSWEYGWWVYIIGRSLRFNLPSASEQTAADTFIATFLTSRPWLESTKQNKQAAGGALNNDEYRGEMIAAIGRDIKEKSFQNSAEKAACDALVAATGNRYLGDKGNIGGSDV